MLFYYLSLFHSCAASKESLNHSGHFFFLNVVWNKCVTMKNAGTVIFYKPVCKYSIHHSDVLGIVWFVLVCECIASFGLLCFAICSLCSSCISNKVS